MCFNVYFSSTSSEVSLCALFTKTDAFTLEIQYLLSFRKIIERVSLSDVVSITSGFVLFRFARDKIRRTLSVAKTLFYVTGIVLIVVLFALNPKMHKKELRLIEYVQYNQNLTVGDKCSIDLVEAEYIASIKQTVGEAELGLQHYHMVKDDTGAAGIAMFEITSDTEKFETMISECLGEPLHFVGIIKEAPT